MITIKPKNDFPIEDATGTTDAPNYEGPGAGSPPGFKVNQPTVQNFPPKYGGPGIVYPEKKKSEQ
ncbi:MAG: hypothetical protein GX295_01830 [Syntrophomonadaceae bacterium]|nr:hypothetical protein [Syntrophomonadaceae bacterium]